MRYVLIVLWMLFGSVATANAQVSIGINLSLFPELVRVPGYPVYYAPRLGSNFFFYDGFYWVYQDDYWYASSWYNGPWDGVAPEDVPLFVLRIPVRYYRNPPVYFRDWRSDAPPRWGDHWGRGWEQRRSGWDSWNRSATPKPAPLPDYQRQYSGNRYPRQELQQALHNRNYGYQPREVVRQQRTEERAVQNAPASAPREEQDTSRERSPRQQDNQRANPPRSYEQDRSEVPRGQSPQRGSEDVQHAAPEQRPQRQQGALQHERQTPASGDEGAQHGRGASQEAGKGQEKEHDKGDERGRERNR